VNCESYYGLIGYRLAEGESDHISKRVAYLHFGVEMEGYVRGEE
jgi:hypothetical protein